MPDSGVRRRRGLMKRLAGIFGRRDSSADPSESDVSGEAMWEAERQHRAEHEQDQSGGRQSTLPHTRHRS